MDFVRWDAEFSDFVDNWFSDLATVPGDFSVYLEPMEQAKDDFASRHDIPEVRVVFAFYDVEEFKERHDDYPSKFAYRNAYSLPRGYQDLQENTVFMAVHEEFSTEVSNWKGILKYDTVHELAHQAYFADRGNDISMDAFEKIIFEGHAMYIAEKISQEQGYNVDYPFLELPEVKLSEVKEELPKKVSGRGDTSQEVSQLFSYGGERFTNAEGYPLAYNVAKLLVEERNYTVREMINLEQDKLEKEVIEALKTLV